MSIERKPYSEKEIINYLFNSNGNNLRELDPNLIPYERDIRDSPQPVGNFEIRGIKIPVLSYADTVKIEHDIICFDKVDDGIVIIEIKSPSETANHKTFGQILYYLTLAKRFKYANGREVKSVRGIVLASEIHESLRLLVKAYENIILLKINLKTYHRTNGGNYIFNDAVKKGRQRRNKK